MPNHVHVLFKPLGEHSLVDILALVEIISPQSRELNR